MSSVSWLKKTTTSTGTAASSRRSGSSFGFSLAFLGKWSLGEGEWHLIHLPALLCLIGGCGALIYTIYHLTHMKYHDNEDPTHAVKVFTFGISLTLTGFVLAIVAAWIKGY